MDHDRTFGSRLREPVRFLAFSASLRRGSLNSPRGEHPAPALDRVE